MLTITREVSTGGYHVEDLAIDQSRIVTEFIDDELANGARRVKFLRAQPMSRVDCDERNRIDFDGDPIYSPETTHELVFAVTTRA